jgi:methylmalonyl-CoA mutase cobalamin-binding subunit
VPSDSHVWNLVALQVLIEEMGHEVVNLGPCVPVEMLLRACHDEQPDCVVISTVNGHGHVDGARIITAVRADQELAALTVVIGGKLGTGGERSAELGAELHALGFDAVFQVGPSESMSAIAALRDFIAHRMERAS